MQQKYIHLNNLSRNTKIVKFSDDGILTFVKIKQKWDDIKDLINVVKDKYSNDYLVVLNYDLYKNIPKIYNNFDANNIKVRCNDLSAEILQFAI